MYSIFAVFFSLLAPGAGAVFNAQYLKGLVFILLFCLGKSFFLPLFLRFFARANLVRGLKIIYIFNIVYISIIAISIIDSALFASDKNANFILAFVCAVCARAVQINTLNENIFNMLSGNNLFFTYVKPPRKK